MSNNQVTLEIRWFYLGTPPPEAEHWFNSSCPGELLGPPEEREDLYLHAPQCEYLNLKLRQGRLELKWRLEALGEWTFDRLTGRGERWQKWICEDSSQQNLLPKGGAGWIAVKKVRSQRQHRGVTGELTRLTVNNRSWWSLAFEAGDTPCRDSSAYRADDFRSGVSKILQTYSGPELLSQYSYAYPYWLSQK